MYLANLVIKNSKDSEIVRAQKEVNYNILTKEELDGFIETLKDPNFVEISSDEALVLTKGNTPEEYFEKMASKAKKAPKGRR